MAINYLLILAEVTPKQCLGPIIISKGFWNAISKLPVFEMLAQQFSIYQLRIWYLASCELQFYQSVSCELWVKNQAVSKESYQSALYQACVISLYLFEVCIWNKVKEKRSQLAKLHCNVGIITWAIKKWLCIFLFPLAWLYYVISWRNSNVTS